MNTASLFPSFFDLREFAQSGSASAGEAGGLVRRQLELPEGPVVVGALHLAAGDHSERVDADEFVIACAGTVSVRVDGTERSLAPGESAVIRAGSAVNWIAKGSATLVFMRYLAERDGDTGLVPIDYEAELAPSGAPLAELLTTPTPACRNFTDYRSPDGEFVCGTWDSTPYARGPCAIAITN